MQCLPLRIELKPAWHDLFAVAELLVFSYIKESYDDVAAVAGYSFTEHGAMSGLTWCQNALHRFSECYAHPCYLLLNLSKDFDYFFCASRCFRWLFQQ